MTALTPDLAVVLRDLSSLPTLRMEHAITARVIAALPGTGMTFRVTPQGRTAGELARHIVSAETRFLTGAATGVFPDEIAELERLETPAALVDWYRSRFEAVVTRLATLPGERLLAPLDYKGLIRMPALGFLPFAVQHTIHHRGQLSVYLKAMGEPAPNVYG